MTEPYRITVCSLPDYARLVAEIYVDDRFIGLLSQEAGPDKTLLELSSDAQPRKFPLVLFEEALSEAKRRLTNLDKPS